MGVREEEGEGAGGRSESFELLANEFDRLSERQLLASVPRRRVFEARKSALVAAPLGSNHAKAERLFSAADGPPRIGCCLLTSPIGKNTRHPCEAVGDVPLVAESCEAGGAFTIEPARFCEVASVELEIGTTVGVVRGGELHPEFLVDGVGVHECGLGFVESRDVTQQVAEKMK